VRVSLRVCGAGMRVGVEKMSCVCIKGSMRREGARWLYSFLHLATNKAIVTTIPWYADVLRARPDVLVAPTPYSCTYLVVSDVKLLDHFCDLPKRKILFDSRCELCVLPKICSHRVTKN
jgi:hypothetical protein